VKKLTIAGASLNQIPFDWENNISNIKNALADAAGQRVDLICFSELAISGYGCEDVFLSDWLSETAFAELMKLAPICKNITACIGLPIRIDGITYNGCAVVQNEKLIGISLKQNLPGDGVHYEPRWFSPWKSGEVKMVSINGHDVLVGDLTYTCQGVSFAFEICEDAWKEIRPAQNHFKRGVELIVNPSASHFAFGKHLMREELIVSSSETYNCAYLFVNQLGNESGRIIYDGDILIAKEGRLLKRNTRLSFLPFKIQCAEIQFTENDSTASKNKIENAVALEKAVNKNEEFVKAVSLALFDYLRKSKSKGFVLSLSGGADSTTCAVLVSEMVRRASEEIGWELFWSRLGFNAPELPMDVKSAVNKLLSCAYQGTKNSSEETEKAASELAQSIGAKYYLWSVEEETASYKKKIETALGRKLQWQRDDIALQNIQARSRSPIIWMLANINQSILLTTSNRSEGDVGYATMDGDTSGSLAPIAGVDKPFIIQWLKWAEKELGYAGLNRVNQLQPTAELRPSEMSQTDEKDLMPYNVLVAIERLAIRDRQSPIQVYEKLKTDFENQSLKEYIKKFYRLWSINQWKRERFAPSFHLDDMNVDPRSWCRFPILSGGFGRELDLL
jgi:NAD+ synthase (glutamine-hydrolysing)